MSLAAIKPLIGIINQVRRISSRETLTGTEADSLIRENQRLKTENVEVKKLQAENEALKKVFSFRQDSGLTLKGARVLLHGREAGREFLLLDAGRNDGISQGDLVIDENRVFIGTVREAGDISAKVVVASSFGESIEVELLPSRLRVLAKGLGSHAFLLELIPADEIIRRGDAVLLASSKGRYPFVIGEIVQEKPPSASAFYEVRAIHIARPEFLNQVFVMHPAP